MKDEIQLGEYQINNYQSGNLDEPVGQRVKSPTVKTFDHKNIKQLIKAADPSLMLYIHALEDSCRRWEDICTQARKKIGELSSERDALDKKFLGAVKLSNTLYDENKKLLELLDNAESELLKTEAALMHCQAALDTGPCENVENVCEWEHVCPDGVSSWWESSCCASGEKPIGKYCSFCGKKIKLIDKQRDNL